MEEEHNDEIDDHDIADHHDHDNSGLVVVKGNIENVWYEWPLA